METRKLHENDLSVPDIGAGDLKEIAGLSYRQVHGWDRRDLLPNQRTSSSGWRKVSRWDAMGLSILAILRDRFGIPLEKQRQVFRWMTGREATPHDDMLVLGAEDLLAFRADGDSDQRLPTGFYESFFEVSGRGRRGPSVTLEIQELLQAANEAGDRIAVKAVQNLGTGLCPLYGALGMMTTGFPVLLVTNLEQHRFLDELTYLEWSKGGLLPDSRLVVTVNDAINRVRTHKGGDPFPVTIRARDVVAETGHELSGKEEAVLTLLRARDFRRMVIEPKGGAYRIEVHQDVSIKDEAEIEALVRDHDYQSITVKRHDGKIVRVAQALSLMVPVTDDGKTPSRAGRHRSSE